MSASEQQIIDYLRRDWNAGLRITTIDQAMRALGLPEDDELRWRAGQALADAWRQRLRARNLLKGLRWLRGFRWRDLFELMGPSALHAEVKQWNPASFVLTNNEKLAARFILSVQHDIASPPGFAAIVAALNLTEARTRAALRMLHRLGFLSLTADDSYRLAPDHASFLKGLGFSFHTVTLANGEQFNVP